MSCKTTALLAAYLDESHDTEGVLAVIRDKYPKSISTYITQIRKECMTLNKPCDSYLTDFAALTSTVRGWKSKANAAETAVLAKALQALQQFDTAPLQQKYNIIRSLRTKNHTGHAATDELLGKLTILPAYIADLKIDLAERTALQLRSSAALVTKSADSLSIDATQFLTRVRSTVVSKKANPFDLACALSCLTGRRMVELFAVGSFQEVKKEPYACIFSGQAKKQVGDSLPYKIPLLAPLVDIQSGLNRLRISKPSDELTNPEINLRYSSSCNAAARRLFGAGRKFHNCRAAYGVVAFHTCVPHTLSLNLWLCKVLGHATLTNSLNYSSIHVTNVSEADKRPFTF